MNTYAHAPSICRRWLEQGPNPLLVGDERAFLARDLGGLLACASRSSTARLTFPEMVAPRSRLVGQLQPAIAGIRSSLIQSHLNHQLVRLAARVALLARERDLPEDGPAIERLVGRPLVLTRERSHWPCRWQRLVARGFRLWLASDAPVPEGHSLENKWRTSLGLPLPADEAAFVRRFGLVQVRQDVPAPGVGF